MELSPEEFEDLVGAFALDACEPDEVDAMERYIGTHREAAVEVERLREIAMGIGAAGALRPPVALRERMVLAAGDRPSALPVHEALERETERFERFLSTVDERDLDVRTHNGLTLRELVQHVEAIDRAFADAAADPESAFIGPDELETITAADLPARAGEPFTETVTRLRRTRRRLLGLHDQLPEDQRVAGYRRDDMLVVRTFETWTHHDDVRRAVGLDEALPDAAVMRTMAELAVKSLPLALGVRGTAQPGRTVRLVLDGRGGGEWMIAAAPGEAPGSDPDVVVRASAVDWCRRFADRIEPDELVFTAEGDEDLAHDLVAAANAFAGL